LLKGEKNKKTGIVQLCNLPERRDWGKTRGKDKGCRCGVCFLRGKEVRGQAARGVLRGKGKAIVSKNNGEGRTKNLKRGKPGGRPREKKKVRHPVNPGSRAGTKNWKGESVKRSWSRF